MQTAADILEELLLAELLPEEFEEEARAAIIADRDPIQIEARGDAARMARFSSVVR